MPEKVKPRIKQPIFRWSVVKKAKMIGDLIKKHSLTLYIIDDKDWKKTKPFVVTTVALHSSFRTILTNELKKQGQSLENEKHLQHCNQTMRYWAKVRQVKSLAALVARNKGQVIVYDSEGTSNETFIIESAAVYNDLVKKAKRLVDERIGKEIAAQAQKAKNKVKL